MRKVSIIRLFFAIFLINNSFLFSASIYRWVDENGVKNFSNFPASVPIRLYENGSVAFNDRYISSLPLYNRPIDNIIDDTEKEYLAEIEKQLERQLLVNKYKELQDRENYLQEQLAIAKNSALKTKREFDNLISKGYFSDHSILELKRLQREMKQISTELTPIAPNTPQILSQADPRGIPNKYFVN